MAEVARFELAHEGVKVPCLTAWLHPNLFMVTRTGFEPVNVAVKGRCVKPLHQRATNGRNYWLCSSVSALSAQRSTIELSSYKWCRRQESNLQPTDYKSVALPVAPRRHMVERERFELPNPQDLIYSQERLTRLRVPLQCVRPSSARGIFYEVS